MVTGVPVTETGGHGVTFNEDNGSTVHATAGHYVASMFDVAHDNGMSTVLYAGKPKFDFVDRSWDGTNGAVDATGPDNGRDKIDVYARGDGAAMTAQLLTRLDTAPPNLAMIHYAATDGAAHESGFLSQEYLDTLTEVDGLIGQILDAVEADPALAETTVIVTTDHGGSGFEHGTPTSAVNYTIPMFVWGDGVSEGVDLYAINGATRSNPGTGRPGYSGGQPIRNADVANLALDLLELDAVTGSTINPAQDLAVEGVPPVNQPPTVSMSTPAAGATVSGASVNVAADATDTDGTVIEVEFFADGTSIGTDSDAGDGWSVAWDTTVVTDGPVDLTATATDDDAAVATSAARSVTVDNDADPGPVVMVVASPTALHASETLVRNRLQTMGFTVNVVDDTGVTAAAANGASFVLISFTVATTCRRHLPGRRRPGVDRQDLPVRRHGDDRPDHRRPLREPLVQHHGHRRRRAPDGRRSHRHGQLPDRQYQPAVGGSGGERHHGRHQRWSGGRLRHPRRWHPGQRASGSGLPADLSRVPAGPAAIHRRRLGHVRGNRGLRCGWMFVTRRRRIGPGGGDWPSWPSSSWSRPAEATTSPVTPPATPPPPRRSPVRPPGHRR